MAQASHRITQFPGSVDPQEPIASIPESLLNPDRDPTREIRNLIEDLQNSAHEARRRQRLAEDEREKLRDRVFELESKVDADAGNENRIKALIRERDLLAEQHAQYGPVIADLNKKIKLLEAEARQSTNHWETAEREKKAALRQAEEANRTREDAVRQRETALKQRDLLREEREQAIEQMAAIKKNFIDAQKALSEARSEVAALKNELASTRKKTSSETTHQLDALRQARDGMATQIKELKDRINELEDQLAEANDAREASEKETKDAKAQLADLKDTLEAAASRTADADRLEELETELNELHRRSSEQQSSLQERDALVVSLEQARASLAEAQSQIDNATRDRASLEQQLSDSASSIETQLRDQAEEIRRLKDLLGERDEKLAESNRLTTHFEKRRLDLIELTAQLENAHREIRTLSANLAEARLHAKLASRQGAGSPQSVVTAPLPETAGRTEVIAMRRCYHGFSRDQTQVPLLSELKQHTSKISDDAMEQGRPILHRVAAAFASLLSDLIETPEQITQSTLRTVQQTIEFIALQIEDSELEGRVNLKDPRVYVVDDDRNTCSTVVDALNLVGLRTNFALFSSAALTELSSNAYDLIILDIHLPDMSGFQLCEQIRAMELHSDTPIFFVTGDASLENRVKSSLRGGNEFVAKPFSIQELALKALTSVITAQIENE